MIDPGSAALLESGGSLIIATVDRELVPNAERAFAVQVLDGGERLRVSVSADATTLRENLATTGAIALTATRVHDNVSVQAKGQFLSFHDETADDKRRRDQHVDEFFTAVCVATGALYEELIGLKPNNFVVFEMSVAELFDQTPGPTAGRRLTPA